MTATQARTPTIPTVSPEHRPVPSGPRRGVLPVFSTLLAAALAAGCAGAGAPGAPADGGAVPEAAWERVREARPEPLRGAARVTVSRIDLLGGGRWSGGGSGVSPTVALQELISANLLRRRDVHFVERRRFAEAVEMERRGRARPEGAPPVGTSPGAELVLAGSWVPAGADSAVLELRLTDAESGRVEKAWRSGTPTAATLPALARLATAGLLRALDELGRRPEWSDPLAGAGVDPTPERYRRAGVADAAVDAFRTGVDAEDRYDWSAAYRAYRRAIELGGDAFYEPEVTLARAARLRAGGTLGESP